MNFEDLKHQILHPEDETDLFDPADMATNKANAIFASFPILFWIPLVACKGSEYGKFCANQGLILFVLSVVLSVVQTILGKILWMIPFVGNLLLTVIGILVAVVEGGCFLLLLISACQGKARRIPIIGSLFEAFN